MSSSLPPRPIRACIFDMDGLLINTEDLITTSINTILHENGKPPLPWHMKAKLRGIHLSEATKILLEWAQLPISAEEYQARLKEEHQRLFPTSQPLPGAEALVRNVSKMEGMEVGLATSSSRERFELKTSHLAYLFDLIPEECQILGDDPRLGHGRGKPEPDIYLLALEAINAKRTKEGKEDVMAGECLAFEDAVAGVQAGRRAGMQVVWCPHPEILALYIGHEQEVLSGMANGAVSEPALERPNGAIAGTDFAKENDGLWSEDGWSRLVMTLKGFPYADCGIGE